MIFSQTNCVKDSWFRAQKDLGYQGDGVQITQLIGCIFLHVTTSTHDALKAVGKGVDNSLFVSEEALFNIGGELGSESEYT